MDALAPWLTDFGSWIFGALIGLNLVILGAILTIGPVDATRFDQVVSLSRLKCMRLDQVAKVGAKLQVFDLATLLHEAVEPSWPSGTA